MYPEYKALDSKEQLLFKEAVCKRIKTSLFYPFLYKHIEKSIVGYKSYFFVCFLILIMNSVYHPIFSLTALFGFLGAQIMFAVFHTRIHALFLEYDQWNVASKNRVMLAPIVAFYAFYHHHHSKGNNWCPEMSYHDSDQNPNGTNYVVLAHWYSFSIYQLLSKLPFAWLFVAFAFYYSPYYSLGAFIGYELGQFFIPVFHGYGHNVADQIFRSSAKSKRKNAIGYMLSNLINLLFFAMKQCKLLATPREHAVHHKNYKKTPYAYRSFSSSGIYSKGLDIFLDKFYVWGFSKLPVRAYDVMRAPALIMVLIAFLLPFALACLFHTPLGLL